MRLTLVALLAVTFAAFSNSALAAVQNVEVFGSIRIRGNGYDDYATMFDDNNPDSRFFEQRTRLGVKADFTQDVSAVIEIDSYNHWGDNFRGTDENSFSQLNRSHPSTAGPINTGTGIDRFSATDVALYQSYIEMNEAWGYALDIAIGRKEMQLGSEWLVGNNDTAALFRGLSFDGIWLTWDADTWSITGFYAKLAELNGGFVEKDGDVDFFGLYASYTGIEDIVIDGYYIYLREGDHGGSFGSRADGFNSAQDKLEIHTFGARAAGERSGFDWEVEGAYQIGDVTDGNITSGTASAVASRGVVGPVPEIEYSAFAFNGEAGYTFDVNTQPRIWIGAAFFQGGDNESDGSASADRGFNRLFSDWEYSEFLANTDLSNVLIIRGGASAQVTEKINLAGVVSWFQVDETRTGGFADVIPAGSKSDDNVGIEVGIYGVYEYSEDLIFEAGYARFFADDGAADGNFIAGNGSALVGGFGTDDDLDYAYLETRIRF